MGTERAEARGAARALQRLIELERERAQLRAQLGLDGPPADVGSNVPSTEAAAYELVARFATDMLSVHDADGRYAWVSDSCEAFGWTPGELLERGAYELIHPDDHPRVLANHQQHAHLMRTPGIDFRLRTGNGEYRWVSTHSSNSKDADGLPRIVCITRDISEQRAKLEELEQLVQQQAQADAGARELLVAVCAWCKAVRDHEGGWCTVEAHLERATGREATHGICPHCVDTMHAAAVRAGVVDARE